MILTKEFLNQQNACLEGIYYAEEKQLIGLDYDEVIKRTLLDGKREFTGWLIEQKSTEGYVKANGSILKMTNYQVFNPLTGQHIECADENEVRQKAVEIAQQILNSHKITVVQCLTNENNDVSWIPTELSSPLQVL